MTTTTLPFPVVTVNGKPLHCRCCGNGPLARYTKRKAPFWHMGRGLCQGCYQPLLRRLQRGLGDELLDYPRLTRRAEDVIEDWQELAEQGLTKRQVAERIGMTHVALDRAICRWRRRQREAAVP